MDDFELATELTRRRRCDKPAMQQTARTVSLALSYQLSKNPLYPSAADARMRRK